MAKAARNPTPKLTGRTIARVLRVEDTRDYELIDDRSVPVAGSGNPHDCDRCGRTHEVYAHVELDDATTAIVGTGCMAKTGMDAAVARSLDSGAKRARKLEAELSLCRERLEQNAAIDAEIAKLPKPEARVPYALGEQRAVCGDASVRIHGTTAYEREGALRSAEQIWLDKRRRERGYHELMQVDDCERIEDRLAAARRKLEAMMASSKSVEENPVKLVTTDPRTMQPAAINKELDRLDKLSSKNTAAFIAAGRSHERPSEIQKMSDPLALEWRAIEDRRDALRSEISRRMGPGRHYRLPRGFGPVRALANPTEHRLPGITFAANGQRYASAPEAQAAALALAMRGEPATFAALQHGEVIDRWRVVAVRETRVAPGAKPTRRSEQTTAKNPAKASGTRAAKNPAMEPLEGSEKQVAWAEKVRAEKRRHWENLVASWERSAVDSPTLLADPAAITWLRAERPIIEAWLDENVWNQRSAKWWIDNRMRDFVSEAERANRSAIRAARKA